MESSQITKKKNNYAKGASKERRIVEILKKDLECDYAGRIAGSHSEVDVVGVSFRWTYLIQSKSTKSLPKKLVSILIAYKYDIDRLNSLKINPSSSKELWIFTSNARKPIKVNVLDEHTYRKAD